MPYALNAEFATYPKADYSSVATATDADTITFDNPCINDFTFSATDSANLGSDNYSGVAVSGSVLQFDVAPAFCVVNYNCQGVSIPSGVSALDCSDFTFVPPTGENPGSIEITANPADYQDGSKPPGTYTVQICGVVADSASQTPVCDDIEVVLQDPCDPPVSITVPTLDDETYIITDTTEPDYTHPEFIADPSYCKVSYTYDLGTVNNKDGIPVSAISRADKTFSWFYD